MTTQTAEPRAAKPRAAEPRTDDSAPGADRIIEIGTLDAPARDRSLTTLETAEADEQPRGGGWIVLMCVLLAAVWIAGSAAYAIGYAGLDALAASTPAQIGGLVFIAIGPALFVLLAGIAARQMVRFAAQARMVASAARRLTRPERELEGEARTLSAALAAELARVNTGMDGALARLGAMEEVIRHHADSLADAARNAGEQSRALIADLRAERDALSALAGVLDEKAKLVADSIAEQSRMVARAAELADGAATEGTERIRASTAALEEASGAALSHSRAAAGVLDAQRQNLDALAQSFAEQGQALNRIYETHRGEMAEADRTLREEQKRIASALDFHRAELGELVKTAGRGAQDMTEATRAGGETLRKAMEDALAQAQALGDMILARGDAAAERQKERLAALEDAAHKARAASEAACASMEIQATAITGKVEQLGETTFDAALRAEKVFDRRIDEAARAVERVARLADEADAKLADRFDRSLETWRERLAEVERRMDSMRDGLGEAPEAMQAQAEALETVVRRGVEGLREAARAAAEEAREIDAALQTRMRHNYELLSDFVLRMGSVGAAAPVSVPAPPLARPAAPAPESARPAPQQDSAPPAPSPPPAKTETGLSWRDIVSGLRDSETAGRRRQPDAAPAPAAPAREDGEALTAEALGADPSALSRAGARDAAHARRSAGIDAMRESVREEAGDHVALLARTMERDPDLRARARRLVGAMEDSVADAAREERADRLVELLSGARGRGYLLLSAALGDA